jgi:DNA polymerase sigma
MEAEVNEDRLECLLCNARFERRKDFAVHVKSMKHQAAEAAVADRQALRDLKESKEASREEFRSRLFPKVDPLLRAYAEESQETLGGIYSPQAKRVPCGSLSDSLDLLYTQSRARPHVVARRKALYKLVFRICKVLFPECKCDVYGSIPHKIDDESSDIDMSVRLEKGDSTPDAAVLDRVGKVST